MLRREQDDERNADAQVLDMASRCDVGFVTWKQQVYFYWRLSQHGPSQLKDSIRILSCYKGQWVEQIWEDFQWLEGCWGPRGREDMPRVGAN